MNPLTTNTPKDDADHNGRALCGCGKSLHQPYCDGSHARNGEQYEEWKSQILSKQSKNTL